MDDGRTPSATPLARVPQEHRYRRDCRYCTPHNIPVLYTPAGREVRAGQHLYIPVRQLSLYEWLPVGKFPQTGPYAVHYCTKAHNQHEPNHWGGPRRRPDPLLGHCHGCISPRRTVVLTQCPHKRTRVACLTCTQQHLPHGPSAHQDCRPWLRHIGGCLEHQNKFKPCTTNRRSTCVTQSARQLRQWRHVDGNYWREWRRRILCRLDPKITQETCQHAGPCGAHQQTGGDAWGLGGRTWRNCLTNGAFLSHRWDQNSGARRCQDQPTRKPPRQWRHAAGQHTAFPATITPGRYPGRLSWASVTPTRKVQRRRSPIVRGRPTWRPPPMRKLYDLWILPVLGAPKFQETTWMEESRKTFSGKHSGKPCFYADPTLQRTFQGIWEDFCGNPVCRNLRYLC